ncbi:hypothetical protein M405DRAFT_473653 [Rhizopogon salebrosus TDB-379]|nr:hypothetical protein M405DRAFT_473653 [Rhizopogon salebrosus TDB-379]
MLKCPMVSPGAIETSTSTLRVFPLDIVLHPEVQASATFRLAWGTPEYKRQLRYTEIDRVVGKDRLPDFDDRPALPYVDAILCETHQVVHRVSYWVSPTQQRPVTFTKVILES